MLVSMNPGGPNGGSATQYFVGDFNGKRFELDPHFMHNLGRVKAIEPEGRIFNEFDGNKYGTHWDINGDEFESLEEAILPEGSEIDDFHGLTLVESLQNGSMVNGSMNSKMFTHKIIFYA